jgi:hypothetical protein
MFAAALPTTQAAGGHLAASLCFRAIVAALVRFRRGWWQPVHHLKGSAMLSVASISRSFPARAAQALSSVALVGLLAACGGGGSETTPTATEPANPVAAQACTKTNAKIGQVATLSTRSHGVQGSAKIIDDCTIEISNFSYDGLGLREVVVYGGKGGDYRNGFAISDNLRGPAFVNQTLKLTLKPGDLDKLDGISIWCTDAFANFGDGTFAAPARI